MAHETREHVPSGTRLLPLWRALAECASPPPPVTSTGAWAPSTRPHQGRLAVYGEAHALGWAAHVLRSGQATLPEVDSGICGSQGTALARKLWLTGTRSLALSSADKVMAMLVAPSSSVHTWYRSLGRIEPPDASPQAFTHSDEQRHPLNEARPETRWNRWGRCWPERPRAQQILVTGCSPRPGPWIHAASSAHSSATRVRDVRRKRAAAGTVTPEIRPKGPRDTR